MHIGHFRRIEGRKRIYGSSIRLGGIRAIEHRPHIGDVRSVEEGNFSKPVALPKHSLHVGDIRRVYERKVEYRPASLEGI